MTLRCLWLLQLEGIKKAESPLTNLLRRAWTPVLFRLETFLRLVVFRKWYEYIPRERFPRF